MRKSIVALAALALAAAARPTQPAPPPQGRDLSRHLVGMELKRDASGLAARGLSVEQLNGKGYGQRALEVREFDAEKRTVEVAFSSEYAEGERWFGVEILDHSPGAIELGRLRDGGALLMDHRSTDQIGVVESVKVGDDRVARAVVRFSRSARAQEIFQDVQDGIRKHISVGYRILEAKLETIRDDDVDVYRVTKWEPYEISFVAIPFDPTVGVGRGLENAPVEPLANGNQNPANSQQTRSQSAPETMNEKVLRDAAGNLVRAQVNESGDIVKVLEILERAGEAQTQAASRALDAERKRGADILAMGESYGCAEQARKAVADGTSVADFTRIALEAVNARGGKPLGERKEIQVDTNGIGMSGSEVRRYSLFKAMRVLANPTDGAIRNDAAFEIECSAAAEKHMGKTSRGLMVPDDVLRAFNAGGMANTPAGATSGANLVQTTNDPNSFIGMLRNRTTILRLARVMAGLVGDVEISKQTGGATAGWIGEGGEGPEGTPTIGQLGLAMKTVSAWTDVSRKLMKQSTPDAEGIVREDLVNAIGQAIDYAGYYGSGSANQPRGLKNYVGINAVDFAAIQPTYPEIVAMETAIAADNADVNSMAYVLNAVGRGAMKTSQKFSGTNGAPIWEQGNTLNGYRTEVTNQVATGDYFFGNFADLVVGMWGGLDLMVDPYSLSKSGGVRIVVFQDVDFVLRRVESICYGVLVP